MHARHHARTVLLLAATLFGGISALISAGGSLLGTLAGLGSADSWPLFVYAALATSFVSGVVIAARQRRGKAPGESSVCLLARATAAAGVLCLACQAIAPDEPARWLAAASGAACGISYPCQLLLWARALAPVPQSRTLAVVALAAASASALALLAFSFNDSVVMAAAFCLSLCASAFMRPQTPPSAAAPVQKPDGHEAEGPSDGHNARILLAGAAVCLFTLTLMWTGPEYGERFPLSALITRSSFVGFAACAGVIGVFSFAEIGGQRLASALAAAAPLFAALPIVPCIVGIDPDPFLGALFGGLTGVGFAFFMTLPLAALCSSSPGSEQTFGIACAALSAAGAVGIAAGGPIVEAGFAATAASALFVSYLVACAMVWRRPKGRERAGDSDPASDGRRGQAGDPIDERCAELARTWMLTPRECDVLPLLARGRTQPRIAQELFLSTETVKVHVRHIYEKAGVHSRDQLMDLVSKR